MTRAINLAMQAAGVVWPRPPVGAVIVKNGHVVGTGHTARDPGPHAEITALERAREAALGSTMYVTLEPCSHFGSTPPCTNAIIDAGINEVVFGIEDPNPLVSGAGIKHL